MYYIVLYLLIGFSIIEILTKKQNSWIFCFIYVLMTFMATFRYGQYGDYFSYNYIYNNYEFFYSNFNIYSDPLFGLLIGICNNWGITYVQFVAAVSLITMGLSFPFFYKSCNSSFLSLLAFYSYTFLMCPMQAIRQGLCLSLLLFAFPLAVQKKNKQFYACVVIGSLIHFSFIISSLIPLIIHINIFNRRKLMLILVAFFCLLAFVSSELSILLLKLGGIRASYYISSNPQSILLQMSLRLLLLVPLMFYNPPVHTSGYYAKAICFTGFVLYCCFSASILIAGRIEYYYRTFECLFIAFLVSQYKSISLRKTFLLLFLSIHVFLWFKNIDEIIERHNYRKSITVFNFPYISVFNKSDLYLYSQTET